MAFVGTRRALLGGSSLPRWAAGFDLWYNYQVPQGSYALGFPPATDTHSSTINALTPAGTYQGFAANVPVRTGLGLQTVPTRTNLSAADPVDFSTWGLANISVTTDSTIAPNNTATADTLNDGVATGVHSAASTFSATSATTYTASFFVKNIDRNFVQILFSSATHSTNAYANFDLSAGTVGTVGASATATITRVGVGFFRITCTAAATATTSGSFQVALVQSASAARAENYTGTSKSIYAWGGQVEAASFASPPILTASATVNGNQQVIDLTGKLGVGVSGIVQMDLKAVANAKRILSFTDGAGAQISVTTAGTSLQIYSSGGATGAITGGTLTAGVLTIAFAASTNYLNCQLVGAAANTALTTLPMPTVDRLAIAGNSTNSTDNNYQYTKKLALKFGPQNASTFAAAFAAAQLAAVSP